MAEAGTSAAAEIAPETGNSSALDVMSAAAASGRCSRALSPRSRALLAVASVLTGCGLWYSVFGKLGVSVEALPWYFTVATIGIVCGVSANRAMIERHAADFFQQRFKLREPLSLLETWAIAYLAAAAALYLWAIWQSYLPPSRLQHAVQFVEIRLVSDRDSTDRDSPLPATQEQALLHKRESDNRTQQGAMTAKNVRQIAQSGETVKHHEPGKDRERTAASKAVEERAKQTPSAHVPVPTMPVSQPSPHVDQVAWGHNMVLVKPASSAMPSLAATQRVASGRKSNQQPLIEEVQPPELVEMVENDGQRENPNLFMSGGNSSGGMGAANDLTVYLKELHKRIKSLWTPPRGQSHTAAVLFRVRKDGRLAFIRLIRSSGSSETDDAAVKAIVGAIKGLQLPKTTELPYLDVQYTFNYTADELKEVKQPQPVED
jgi:TonB family protein